MNSHSEYNEERIAGSFRDPSGFVFRKDGALYRKVNKVYAKDYDFLMQSGLYGELTKKNLLVKHEDVQGMDSDAEGYKVIRPEFIPFISYPYEWCFSQLKDAALLTLKIQKITLRYGMTLKDASAYNIQFKDGQPILIDTLSFAMYEEGTPWAAYLQFCGHFLAPLALMGLKDIRLNQLLRIYIDGIPLDLASVLLPMKSWFKPAIFFHIHMHAKSQRHYSDKKVSVKGRGIDRTSLDTLIESLRDGVLSLGWQAEGTEWGDYYGNTNYSDGAMAEKGDAVSKFIKAVNPKVVWDLGANDGFFSRLASDQGAQTIAFDVDPAAVEKGYLEIKNRKEKNLLPLLMDLTNPSPALGWNNEERSSLAQRGPADLALALALIHHLTITNNVPFEVSAEFFSNICKALIIEFVPKDDSQVQRLLRNRGDVFDSYTKEYFESEFERYFSIRDTYHIPVSKRILYLMKKRSVLNGVERQIPEKE